MKTKTSSIQFQILFFCLLSTFTISAQVGIGTSTPTAQLTVMEDGVFNESGGNHDFRIESNNKTNMFLVDGTNDHVLINTSTHVNGDIFTVRATTTQNGVNPWSINSYNDFTDGGAGFFHNTIGTNGFNAIEGITSYSGNASIVSGVFGLAISTNANQAAIGVRGHSNNSDGMGVRGTIPTTGTWLGFGGYFTGGLGYGNGIYNISDARTKKDITRIESALSKILQINGHEYKYDFEKHNSDAKNNDKIHYGFMAQNVKEFLPHAVAQKNVQFDDDFQTSRNGNKENTEIKKFDVVDYTAIIPVAVEAIKEQQEIMEAQNNKIAILENKMAILENKLNTLIEEQD